MLQQKKCVLCRRLGSYQQMSPKPTFAGGSMTHSKTFSWVGFVNFFFYLLFFNSRHHCAWAFPVLAYGEFLNVKLVSIMWNNLKRKQRLKATSDRMWRIVYRNYLASNRLVCYGFMQRADWNEQNINPLRTKSCSSGQSYKHKQVMFTSNVCIYSSCL